jgi:transcriptional regulator with XRE-family HTH domain
LPERRLTLNGYDELREVPGLMVVLLRSLRHWSQTDLAKATGIQKSQISDYELWKTVPSETTLKRCAAAVRVTWEEAGLVLPALNALCRMSIRPLRRPVRPAHREMAAEMGRETADGLRESFPAILRENLPALAAFDEHLASSEPSTPLEPGDDRPALGLLVVLLRSLRHWTQEELADASGVHRGQISSYELWRTKPSEATLQRLATAVGVPPEEALATLPFLRFLTESATGRRRRVAVSEEIARAIEDVFRLELPPLLAELFPNL